MLARLKQFPATRMLLVIVVIVMTATLLRVWQLPTVGILYGDAARDLLVAKQAVESKHLPLLGIPSSVPQFHQGPLTIWLHMILFAAFGTVHQWYAIAFALIGVLAVIAVYELFAAQRKIIAGWVAALCVAVSPLAIAQSRVPYHVTPIPLMTVLFIWAVWRYARGEKHGLFGACLAWAVLLQFELALTPLLAVVGFIWFVRRPHRNFILPTRREVAHSLGAISIGLLPQLLYDLTHGFSHFGRFAIWVIDQLIVSILHPDRTVARIDHWPSVWRSYSEFGGRIVGVDGGLLKAAAGLSLVIAVGFMWWKYRKEWTQCLKQGTSALEKLTTTSSLALVTMASIVFLTLGYVLHGSPSEAYFPVYVSLLAILLGVTYESLSTKPLKSIMVGLLIGWAVLVTTEVVQSQFFTQFSPESTFRYGLNISEQREVLAVIARLSNQQPVQLASTTNNAHFATYFDSYYWLNYSQPTNHQVHLLPYQPDSLDWSQKIVFIEPVGSRLRSYPGMIVIPLEKVEVYVWN